MTDREKALSEDLAGWALAYAEGGFHVFPLEPGGKRPLPGTHGFRDATTDPETIRRWWSETPLANIGVACGESGIVVLDIDVKGGKDARPALKGRDLDGAWVVQTPTGGFHYWWKADGERFQSGSDLYGVKGLDIRAAGGYVVAQPSVVARPDGQTGAYTLIGMGEGGLAPVPRWLVDLEHGRQAPKAPVSAPAEPTDVVPLPKATPEQAREVAEVMERARRYVAKMPAAVSGSGGHVALLNVATVLAVGFRLPDEEAFALLEEYSQRCSPPWSRAELEHKLAEARRNKLGKRPGYKLDHGRPLRNFTVKKETVVVKGVSKEVEVKSPRPVMEIGEEVLRRCDGFPKRLGERLFYLKGDPAAGRAQVVSLHSADSLDTWIQNSIGALTVYSDGAGYPTKNMVREELLGRTERFDAVSRAPWYPERREVLSLCGELPAPTEGARSFWRLVEFMCPATDGDRLLMAAFFCAPMYFSANGDSDRPGWLIDTEDAQASGKTSVVEICARIYDCRPLALDFATLDRAQESVKKRIVSSEGRDTRIALFDNVAAAKTIKSPVLASLVTSKKIGERAAYGRDEEHRPNDLTWVITVNQGSLDTDLCSRFYPVVVKKPETPSPFWKRKVFAYIDENRLQILADIRAMVKAAHERAEGTGDGEEWTRRESRFGEFDATVLGAVCRTREEFDAVDQRITQWMSDANDDRARAERFETAFLKDLKKNAGTGGDGQKVSVDAPLVVFKDDLDAFIEASEEVQRMRPAPTSKDVRSWIKSGLLPGWSKEFRKVNKAKSHGDDLGRAAFLYRADCEAEQNEAVSVQIVIRRRNDTTGVQEWVLQGSVNMKRMP